MHRIKSGLPISDAGYDGYHRTRLLVIRRLKAIPLITLNEPEELQRERPRGEDGRCMLLRYRWRAKNFLKRWWVDPDSGVRQGVRRQHILQVGVLREEGLQIKTRLTEEHPEYGSDLSDLEWQAKHEPERLLESLQESLNRELAKSGEYVETVPVVHAINLDEQFTPESKL